MPFYDLKCNECSKEFNVMAKMSEREQKLIHCPSCGSNELSPVFKSVHFSTGKRKDADCPNLHQCGGCCSHR